MPALRKLVADTIAAYNALGVGRNDRIGIVLANGPEMATTFLAVAAGATAAPLNPGYRADEFEFYLSDLNAKALIVAQGSDSPAVGVAKKLNVPVIELIAHPERGAGSFELKAAAPAGAAAAHSGYAEADDVALVLHTSGTTSRPKIVPLSQRNVCASARNVRDTLALTAQDRGLNIMPLFHIHGLIAGVLAPLSAGGYVCCTPGFNALKFFAWMDEAKPTWYTAVPTMHQAILGRARKQQGNHRPLPAALHPLLFVGDADAGDPRAGGDLPCPADRGLRHDRGGAPDGQQPAAAGRASRERWASPPVPRWRSWMRTASCWRPTPPARS